MNEEANNNDETEEKKNYKNNQPAIPIMCTYIPGFCYCQTKEKT